MPQIAIVTWEDSFATEKDFEKASDLEHERESFKIISIGWLIKDTAKILTLGMDVEESTSDDKSYRNIMRIRKENIRSIEVKDV